MKVVYFIFVLYLLGSISAQSNNECITPNNEPGICISILKCPVLKTTVLEHRNKTEYINLLKASFCGYEDRTPKVCCPLDKPSPQAEEVRPQAGDERLGSKLPSKATCGKVEVSRIRILGELPAELGTSPWIALLGYQSVHKKNDTLRWACGGTLISERYVITAAHCVQNRYGSKAVVVRLGELNLDPNVDDGAMPLDVPIEKIISHESYSTTQFINDIALLKLKYKVNFTKHIKPICLLEMDDMNKFNLSRSIPYVAGWGSNIPDSNDEYITSSSTALMEFQVPIVSSTFCKYKYSKERNVVIDDRVICAGYENGGKNSCRGDSGGPLIWPKGNQYYLMGVMSFGATICGQPGIPVVYTKIPSFINWIEKNIE